MKFLKAMECSVIRTFMNKDKRITLFLRVEKIGKRKKKEADAKHLLFFLCSVKLRGSASSVEMFAPHMVV